jgi:hypothetical protein
MELGALGEISALHLHTTAQHQQTRPNDPPLSATRTYGIELGTFPPEQSASPLMDLNRIYCVNQ